MTAAGVVGGDPEAAPARFNPFDPAFRADPYPQYHRLRERAPVHRALGMWVLTRHDDVTAALRDRTTSVGLIPDQVERQLARLPATRLPATRLPAGRLPSGEATSTRIARLARTSLVFTDDPAHARLRALAGRVFGPRTVAALRPHARGTARRLAAPLWRDGGFDAVADLAAPLPLAVLTEAMALPEPVRERVADWTRRVRFLLEPGLLDPVGLTDTADAVDAFAAALAPVAAERRRGPGDDLLSALGAARGTDGDALDDEELVLVAIMVFVAGLETSSALVANAVHALLAHPGQAAAVRRDPALVPSAVAEVLRYDSPLQLTKRRTTRPGVFSGVTVPAGAQLLLCLGAANRDPEVFADPDALDVTRAAGAHLAYGRGLHGCVGAALAGAIAEAAVAELFCAPGRPARGPGEVTWQDHSQIVRAAASLPVVAR